jgi:hypothetical protein
MLCYDYANVLIILPAPNALLTHQAAAAAGAFIMQ